MLSLLEIEKMSDDQISPYLEKLPYRDRLIVTLRRGNKTFKRIGEIVEEDAVKNNRIVGGVSSERMRQRYMKASRIIRRKLNQELSCHK